MQTIKLLSAAVAITGFALAGTALAAEEKDQGAGATQTQQQSTQPSTQTQQQPSTTQQDAQQGQQNPQSQQTAGRKYKSEEIQAMWKKADSDQDGSVSKEELTKSDSTAAQGFDKADSNRDGKLSQTEYKAMLSGS